MNKTCLTLLVGLLLLFVATAQAQILFEIVYDDGNSVYYSGRPLQGDTCGVWFEPPTDSKICSTRFTFNDGMGGDADVFIALMAPGFDPDDYYDSDEVAGAAGPTPIGEIIVPPFTFPFNQSGDWQTINWSDWVSPPEVLDIGTQPFYVGWVLLGGYAQPYYPSILGDAADDRPYHSLTYLTDPGGVHPGESGWWAYGIDWFVRTTVDMYGDPPPVITGVDEPPDTYAPGPYDVSAYVTDLWPGGVPGQVDTVNLVYTLSGDTLVYTLGMDYVSDSTYEAQIPTQPIGTTISYQVVAEDDSAHVSYAPSQGSNYVFTYREPSGAKILLVNDSGDTEGEPIYRYALESEGYSYDYWYIAPGDPDDMGYAGTDVFDAAIYNSIIWFNGTGYSGSLPDSGADLSQDPVSLFMDGGGNFFLSSSDYIGGAYPGGDWDEFTAYPGMFIYDYLWVESGWSDAHLDTSLGGNGESMDTMYIGVEADPISGDWSTSYCHDDPDPCWNDFTYPVPGADVCFNTQIDDEPAGIHYDGAYKMVFLPWVLEALVSSNVAKGILVNTLEWFGEGKIELLEGSRYGISGEPQPFLALTTHPDLINQVRIFLNVDGGGWASAPMNPAGPQDQWTFTIPPASFTNTLEYYIWATTTGDVDTMTTPTYECWVTTFTPGTGLIFCSDQFYTSIDYDTTITDILDGLAVTYDVYDVDEHGAPDYYTILSNYTDCFWIGYGDYDASVFPPNSLDNPLTNFLLQGNNLLFSGEEMIGYTWGSVDFAKGNFAYDWLHIGDVTADAMYYDIQTTADPLVATLTSPFTLAGYDTLTGNWTDYFFPTSGTEAAVLFSESPGTAAGNPCGIRDNVDQHNTIALGFCLFMMDYANRETFISNVFDHWGTNPGTGVEKPNEAAQPITYELQQNFPNPFNPITNIRFAIPENAKVELTIYNLMGQEVAKLVDRNMNVGWHNVTWNASQLASGIYFYKIETANFEQARKMILVK